MSEASAAPGRTPHNTERSPRRGMCAAVLSLEAIALGLTTPVMITIADVDTSTALSVGLGLAVVCLLLAGALRAEWAYLAGYVVQVAAIASSCGLDVDGALASTLPAPDASRRGAAPLGETGPR